MNNNHALHTLLATAALNLCLLTLAQLARALYQRWVVHRGALRIQSPTDNNCQEGRWFLEIIINLCLTYYVNSYPSA